MTDTRPSGLSLLTIAVAAGVVGGVLTVAYAIVLVGVVETQGVRDALAHSAPFVIATVVYAIAGLIVWLLALAMIIVHLRRHSASWRESRENPELHGSRVGRMWLLVLSWVFIALNPILGALTITFVGIAAVALGAMCGEAVSATCGL
jgi:hypothetical protein